VIRLKMAPIETRLEAHFILTLLKAYGNGVTGFNR